MSPVSDVHLFQPLPAPCKQVRYLLINSISGCDPPLQSSGAVFVLPSVASTVSSELIFFFPIYAEKGHQSGLKRSIFFHFGEIIYPVTLFLHFVILPTRHERWLAFHAFILVPIRYILHRFKSPSYKHLMYFGATFVIYISYCKT